LRAIYDLERPGDPPGLFVAALYQTIGAHGRDAKSAGKIPMVSHKLSFL
jgi:hypothetical protein